MTHGTPSHLAAACALLAGMLLLPGIARAESPSPASGTTQAGQVLPAPLARLPHGTVTHIIDGDTVRLADRRQVRLACIDAPDMEADPRNDRGIVVHADAARERNFRVEGAPAQEADEGKTAGGPQFFAATSRQVLVNILRGKRVTLLADRPKTDRHGRIVADLLLENGTSLSRQLVENGLAYLVHDDDFPEAYQEALLRGQQRAIASRSGFWAHLLSIEAARQPYTGSQETRLFYANHDVRARKIKPRKRVYFGNLMDAFSAGFAPARSTDFWPSARRGDDRAGRPGR